ncbi:MAG: hypothetical protein PHU88_10530 [candidate division Zixibacteria bacterium]|nr:hypothetical protein [candidate division Zixibacteria bacterium]MDD5426115.1 hypothetical protein [candidate division Zixibacteria bacterium]
MMKRFLFLLTVILGSLALTGLWGCSDDDDNPVKQESDPNAPEIQFFGDVVVDQPMELTKYSVFTTLALLDSFLIPDVPGKILPRLTDTRSAPLIVFDSVEFDSSAGWLIFYFEYSAIEIENEFSETLAVYGTDSLKVYENDAAVYILTGIPDSIEAREHFHVEYANSDEEEIYGVGHHTLKITGVIPDSTVINAWALDSIVTCFIPEEPGITSCSLHVEEEVDVTNLTIDFSSIDVDDICPLAGRVDIDMTLGLVCTGDSSLVNVNGDWTMLIIFNGTTQSLTVTYGDDVWHRVIPCGE